MTDVDIDEIRDRLDLGRIYAAAYAAARSLLAGGCGSVVRFSPGDATEYVMIVAIDDRDRTWLGSTYGPAYETPDHGVSPGYVAGKWLDPRYRNTHTSVVYAEFINELVRLTT